MIITTTDQVEGTRVAGYLGIVSGEAVVGTNIFRDLMAESGTSSEGEPGATSRSCDRRRMPRYRKWATRPRALGANAVIGVDLDYEHLGGGNKSMLMVTANGTAVKLRRAPE